MNSGMHKPPVAPKPKLAVYQKPILSPQIPRRDGLSHFSPGTARKVKPALAPKPCLSKLTSAVESKSHISKSLHSPALETPRMFGPPNSQNGIQQENKKPDWDYVIPICLCIKDNCTCIRSSNLEKMEKDFKTTHKGKAEESRKTVPAFRSMLDNSRGKTGDAKSEMMNPVSTNSHAAYNKHLNEMQTVDKNLNADSDTSSSARTIRPCFPHRTKLTTRAKKELPITRVGPLQIHGNIEPESVILPSSPGCETSATAYSTVNRSPFDPSIPLTVCPALLRAALRGEGRRRRCCCSATLMPVVTDLEYDALITGQPPHSQQILVVCVTHTVRSQDPLENLYKKQNKHRTLPCTQSQMDSFRLVRYEMSAGKDDCGSGLKNILLQQRHNAAPGMVLMYIRGNLLFMGYIFSGDSCSAEDLHKQISRSRRSYRLGVCLPSDYKFSDNVNNPAATETYLSSDIALRSEDFIT